jgi:hypothetical protein
MFMTGPDMAYYVKCQKLAVLADMPKSVATPTKRPSNDIQQPNKMPKSE